MSVSIDGFEELDEAFDGIRGEVDSLQKSNSVAIEEVFSPGFMRAHTEFETIVEFFEESPWKVETETDFDRLPADEFDEYVDEHTGFNSWRSMLSTAAREWLLREAST
jgi:hypothetical protein